MHGSGETCAFWESLLERLFAFCSSADGRVAVPAMGGSGRYPLPWALIENDESLDVMGGTGQAGHVAQFRGGADKARYSPTV